MYILFWKGTYSSNQYSITDTQIWCNLLNWPGSCFHGEHQIRSPSPSLGQLHVLFSFLVLNIILVEIGTKAVQNCHRNCGNHLWQSMPCATKIRVDGHNRLCLTHELVDYQCMTHQTMIRQKHSQRNDYPCALLLSLLSTKQHHTTQEKKAFCRQTTEKSLFEFYRNRNICMQLLQKIVQL